MKHLIAFISGALFAIGLAISGMTEPSKVIGFLDVAGNWDPSLACVMGGALLVNTAAYAWTKRRETPRFGGSFDVRTDQTLTWQLIVGAALFGIGWGLAGYCPGPALTAVPTMDATPLIFVGTMILGVLAYSWTSSSADSSSSCA
jgi:hypothetical protein